VPSEGFLYHASVQKEPIYAVILAGGQSSRLFPFNKVLSDLTGSGRSLIQQAFDRVQKLSKKQTYILTGKDMVAPIRRQLKLPPGRVFVDPARRGTWPAILWAMAHLRHKNPDALMAVLTGDHVIQGDRAFLQACRKALTMAQTRPAMVMLGIPPSDRPDEWRGFGCFRADKVGRVIEFQEKPTSERAKDLIRTGAWQWNSGMFFFRISTAEAALQRLQPEMYRVYEAIILAIKTGKKNEAAIFYQDFLEKITHPLDPGHYVDNSIDYAVMTPLVSRATDDLGAYAVCDIGFRWTDLGQWDALKQVLKPDRRGNIRIGNVHLKRDVRDSIGVAESGYSIIAEGAKNLIMAVANQTALVLSVENLPRVKEAAQEALKHPDRIVMEHDVTDCDFKVTGGRLVAIGLWGLRIHLQRRRLVVSTKRRFIR